MTKQKTILDVVGQFRKDDLPLTYLDTNEPVAVGKFLEFEMFHWNGKARLVPTEALNLPGRPSERSFMYRGQTDRYPTCFPSAIRNNLDDEKHLMANLALERVRVAELELLLRNHPFKAVADKRGCYIDYHALAQHYGIPTSLLDLTSNVEIAAFFAVAKWDTEAASFKPMESGKGVMYRFDWTAIGRGYTKFFEPVGIGPGLRPTRQHAWTFRPYGVVDFLKIQNVDSFEFTHCKAASDALFRRFDSGRYLFPADCLASLVEKIRDLPFVTMHAIRHAAKQDGLAQDEVEKKSKALAHFISSTLNLDICDGYELQPEKRDLDVARSQALALENALNQLRIGFRLVRTIR